MAEKPQSGTDIQPTDIVFDCPHCSKSLAIDYRGAGLSFPCTDCGTMVPVPIPEGMELNDIDSSEQDKELHLLNLRKSLAATETRVLQLEAEVRRLTAERDQFRKSRTNDVYQTGAMLEKIGVMQKAAKELSQAVENLSTMVQGEST
jgi:transcription elongation factor Elf1